MKRLGLGVILAILSTAPALGAIVTLNITGAIQSVSGGLTSEFAVGEAISGSFSYNTSTPDTNGSPITGSYPISFDANWQFGDYSVLGVGGTVFVENNFASFRDLFEGFVSVPTLGAVAGAPVGAFVPVFLDLVLQDFGQSVFSSDAIPAPSQLTDFTQFESRTATIGFRDASGQPATVIASITAIQPQQVSEPLSLMLIGLGLAAIGVVRRHNKT